MSIGKGLSQVFDLDIPGGLLSGKIEAILLCARLVEEISLDIEIEGVELAQSEGRVWDVFEEQKTRELQGEVLSQKDFSNLSFLNILSELLGREFLVDTLIVFEDSFHFTVLEVSIPIRPSCLEKEEVENVADV